MKEEANRTPRNRIVSGSDEKHDKRKRDSGRVRYSSRRKLLIEHPENEGSRVWAASTRAAMNVRLGWLAAVLQPDESGRYSSRHLKAGGRLLLTGNGGDARTMHIDLIVRG